MLVRGFAPIANADALVVILGTLPGGSSLDRFEYYADRTNVFWDIMGSLFGAQRNLPYEERINIISQNRVAIWDVLQSAKRDRSIDKAIVKGSEVPNDFNAFFSGHPSIKAIVFNGKRPQTYFQSLVAPRLISLVSTPAQRVLPSTSQANTHMTRDATIKVWRFIQT